MINAVFKIGSKMPKRSRYKVLAKVMEEVGELAQEVAIVEYDSYKKQGEDGVVGEAIDAIVALIDLIKIHDPTITKKQIVKKAKLKLKKWKKKGN